MQNPSSKEPPAHPNNSQPGFRQRLAPALRAIKSVYFASKPARLTLLVVLINAFIFLKVEQAQEVLRCLAEGPTHPGTYADWRVIIFFFSLTVLSLASWYFSRLLLLFHFDQSPQPSAASGLVKKWLPCVLGSIPPVVLGIAFCLSARTYSASSGDYVRGLLWGLGLICFGLAPLFCVFFNRQHAFLQVETSREISTFRNLERNTKLIVIAALSFSVVLFCVLLINPVGAAQLIGSGSVILLAAAAWIVYGNVFIYGGSRLRVHILLPSLLLFAVCSLVNNNHDIRYLKGGKPAPGLLPTDQFSEWYSNLCAEYPSDTRHPVIVVGAAGGGIRAAFWTATVLGALQDANSAFGDHVFAISGVSGGSLGAAVFNALLSHGQVQGYQTTSQRVLSHDFLSPTLAYMLFPDTAQRFLPFPVPCFDRARALQMGWEAGWEKTIGTTYFAEDFGELWRRPGRRHIPSLFFNGTSVETGKRLIMSNVQLDGSFVDCEEVARLLPAPVALSTAVDMSTRFTYVSPLGRFTNGEHIADGGYFENSGAATASDIMDIVTAEAEQYSNSIVPVLILISNDPAEADEMPAQFKGSEFISEVVGPFNTLLQTREARGAYSVMDVKSRLNRTNFFKFSLVGARSPLPLGWSLSRSAISEMNRLLAAQSNTTAAVLDILPRR